MTEAAAEDAVDATIAAAEDDYFSNSDDVAVAAREMTPEADPATDEQAPAPAGSDDATASGGADAEEGAGEEDELIGSNGIADKLKGLLGGGGEDEAGDEGEEEPEAGREEEPTASGAPDAAAADPDGGDPEAPAPEAPAPEAPAPEGGKPDDAGGLGGLTGLLGPLGLGKRITPPYVYMETSTNLRCRQEGCPRCRQCHRQ